MARLKLLSVDEFDYLYGLPVFDEDEKHFFFILDDDDRQYLTSLSTTADKIDYILQLGYYHATGNFFSFSIQKVKADVVFILEQYFPEQPFPKKQISNRKHYKNKDRIIDKLGLKEIDDQLQQQLVSEAKRLAKIHALPKFIVTGVLSYCQQNALIKPAYTKLQSIIADALTAEQDRLTNLIYTNADNSLRSKLDQQGKIANIF